MQRLLKVHCTESNYKDPLGLLQRFTLDSSSNLLLIDPRTYCEPFIGMRNL